MDDETVTEEDINILHGFAKYFKMAAKALERENQRQHGIQSQQPQEPQQFQPAEEQPKPFVKQKPMAQDWM